MAARTAGAALPASPVPAPAAAARAEAPEALRSDLLNKTVLVAGFGYFVDIYDLILFSIVRIPSLQGIGVPQAELLPVGVMLLNFQMVGMLLGGLLWGVLGDRRGRVSVLYGSIFLYSAATLANAFVTDVPSYAALRLLAGIGLAGELGAAITLVTEVMTKESRGYGTMMVAGIGVFGAIAAGLVGTMFAWQTAYIVGGVLGFLLLATRYRLADSGMFRSLGRAPGARRGDLRMLLRPRGRALRYVSCVLIGVPIWFVLGVLVTFAPELAPELGVTGPLVVGSAVMATYGGLAVGDFASGWASQRLRSRWWTVLLFTAFTMALVFVYFLARGLSPGGFYALCFALGLGAGYWAVFVTVAAEQFGTNLRATVTTTVPNFVRGSVVPVTLAFAALGPVLGLARSALAVGAASVLLALWALRNLGETYGRDLDFVEE